MDILCFLTLGFYCAVVDDSPLIVYYQENDILSAELWLNNIPSGYECCEIRKKDGALIQDYTFQNYGSQKLSLRNNLMRSDDQTVLEIILKRYWSEKEARRLQIIKLVHSNKKKHCINEKCTIHVDFENDVVTWGKRQAWNRVPTQTVDSAKVYYYAATDINRNPHVLYFKTNDVLDIALNCTNLPNFGKKVRIYYELNLNEGSATYRVGANERVKLNETLHNSYMTMTIKVIYESKNSQSAFLRLIHLKYDKNRHDQSCLTWPCKIVLDWNHTITYNNLLPDEDYDDSKHSRERNFLETKNFPETPYVWIEPSYSPAYFEVNSIKTFQCSGSKPLSGRVLKWYIEGLSSNEFNLAITQSYDWDKNTNNLTLNLNESYHLKTIYCAQEYYDKRLNNSNYGEKYRSHDITLKMNQEELEGEQNAFINGTNSRKGSMAILGKNSTMLVVFLVSLMITVLLIALCVWMARNRRNDRQIKNQDSTECNYATAQVTYAILDMPTDSTKVPPKKEMSPYVEIIGIYH